jgi:hypothetical protein
MARTMRRSPPFPGAAAIARGCAIPLSGPPHPRRHRRVRPAGLRDHAAPLRGVRGAVPPMAGTGAGKRAGDVRSGELIRAPAALPGHVGEGLLRRIVRADDGRP